MNLTESVLNYRQYLKRKNYSAHTVKNYLHRLQRFLIWISVPVESVKPEDVKHYIDFLLEKQLASQTINGHLVVIRRFYLYLNQEEEMPIDNTAFKEWLCDSPNQYPGIYVTMMLPSSLKL